MCLVRLPLSENCGTMKKSHEFPFVTLSKTTVAVQDEIKQWFGHCGTMKKSHEFPFVTLSKTTVPVQDEIKQWFGRRPPNSQH
jgi:hypothetical protein